MLQVVGGLVARLKEWRLEVLWMAYQWVEMVKFSYLGNVISNDGGIAVMWRSESQRQQMLLVVWRSPSLLTIVCLKCAVYKGVALATLLYGSECWAVKANQIHCLEVFHHRCVRCILGVTRYQQWTGQISNNTLLRVWDVWWLSMLMERHMRWLRHVCRMDVNWQLKMLLFGELVTLMAWSNVGGMLYLLTWRHLMYHWMIGMI